MYRLANTVEDNGFTLIESLVVVAVSTIIFLAIVSSVRFFYQTNDYSIEQAAAITQSRTGIENMVQNIREASFSEVGAYPVVAMSTSSFSFYSDVDRDDTVERVTYNLDGAFFRRTTTKPNGSPASYENGDTETRELADSVRNNAQATPVFRYFDVTGAEITDLSQREQLAFVAVRLIVNIDPNRQPDNITLYSTAALRNVHKPS